MDPHLARDVGEVGERQLDHRMESDEAADTRVHLLDRQRRVTAAERVHPALDGDRVRHDLRRSGDVVQLRPLDAVHRVARVLQPLLRKHRHPVLVVVGLSSSP